MTVNLMRVQPQVQGPVGKFIGQREESSSPGDPYSQDRAIEDIHMEVEPDGFVFIFVRVTLGGFGVCGMWKYKGPLENQKEGAFEINVIRCELKMANTEFRTLRQYEKDDG